MKILLGYAYYPYGYDIKEQVDNWVSRLNIYGFNVTPVCLTIDPPNSRLSWAELNWRWQIHDKQLMDLYKSLAKEISHYDVFLNYNGINLHPDFVRNLPTFNVLGCFDDPESSHDLSMPVAWAYDLCAVGNIAEVNVYYHWGARRAFFWPMGFFANKYDPTLSVNKLLRQKRPIDIVFIGDRLSRYRRDRIEKYFQAFPDGHFYGEGWPRGFLPENKRIPILQTAKIGINIHNSTGPVNERTYYLPANGVMQICDNPKYLSRVFKLNREVIGFENIDQAINLTKYYLRHDSKRLNIAVAGFMKATAGYQEKAIFQLLVDQISKYKSDAPKKVNPKNFLQARYKRTWFLRNLIGFKRRLL